MALKTTASKSKAHAKSRHSAAKRAKASTKAKATMKREEVVVTKISRRYLSPMGRSEVGVAQIRRAVKKAAKQAAKDTLATSADSLKKAAKAI